ncbi:MAG: phytanoyl-CoA dioxygenase family protein [Rhodospirillaceae bacterium]|nr:phytanoyl-CoA dioxygenase family protein [Rhodospirillaceae bacterium]MDD9924524.1 phytanoyl-CoA dioxygenase family protein [Rhodospirillaceae bacterium]
MTEPSALSQEAHAEGLVAYRTAGQQRARDIGNRGPLRLTDAGGLHPAILGAYREHGYYVFTGILDDREVAELRHDVAEMLARAPIREGAETDAQGRPALGIDYARSPYVFAKPLSDPWGGTEIFGGRHQVRMAQPAAGADAPAEIVFTMIAMCQALPAGLRLYGHPGLLAIAASINGEDFVPFNDSIFVKEPGLGGAVAWHQDGVTHWESPDWDPEIHGFNFQAQLYDATLGNCLWVLPGSHKRGKIDIKALVHENGGSEQLPGAVPLECAAGDVLIINRQILHGSFANTSPDRRISLTFGFHRRASVLGVKMAGGLSQKNPGQRCDAQRIFDRSAVIQLAIDARHQARPDEPCFAYKPFAGLEDDFRFNDDTSERFLRDYYVKDLAI